LTSSDIVANKHTSIVKSIAKDLGFDFCGISKAEQLSEEAFQLENWLNKGMHGQMSYMENHFDKRIDPRQLVPGAKSVISLLFNYYTDTVQDDPESPKLSIYAMGEDYHFVIKRKLFLFIDQIRLQIGEVEGRVFVDSAPIMDKAWAKRSGLGWIGKNSNLINKQQGSFFFIAELILDLNLEADGPIKDYCGSCTRCIDACPTEAIVEPHVVNGSKCISYFTIELKDQIPASWKGKFDDWMFGCDVCQTVCPWNRFSKQHQEPAFNPSSEMTGMKKADWQELTEETFNRVFGKSAVKRTGFLGLKRNIDFISNADS
jgi:epoxyqueuosine reductase